MIHNCDERKHNLFYFHRIQLATFSSGSIKFYLEYRTTHRMDVIVIIKLIELPIRTNGSISTKREFPKYKIH